MSKAIVARCFCCSTRFGCIIIGAVELVVSIVRVALILYQPPDVHHSKLEENTALYGVALAMNILIFACALSICFGAVQGRRHFLIPLMVMQVFLLVFSTVVLIMGAMGQLPCSMPCYTVYVMGIVLCICFLIVVFSHYHLLKERQN